MPWRKQQHHWRIWGICQEVQTQICWWNWTKMRLEKCLEIPTMWRTDSGWTAENSRKCCKVRGPKTFFETFSASLALDIHTQERSWSFCHFALCFSGSLVLKREIWGKGVDGEHHCWSWLQTPLHLPGTTFTFLEADKLRGRGKMVWLVWTVSSLVLSLWTNL